MSNSDKIGHGKKGFSNLVSAGLDAYAWYALGITLRPGQTYAPNPENYVHWSALSPILNELFRKSDDLWNTILLPFAPGSDAQKKLEQFRNSEKRDRQKKHLMDSVNNGLRMHCLRTIGVHLLGPDIASQSTTRLLKALPKSVVDNFQDFSVQLRSVPVSVNQGFKGRPSSDLRQMAMALTVNMIVPVCGPGYLAFLEQTKCCHTDQLNKLRAITETYNRTVNRVIAGNTKRLVDMAGKLPTLRQYLATSVKLPKPTKRRARTTQHADQEKTT